LIGGKKRRISRGVGLGELLGSAVGDRKRAHEEEDVRERKERGDMCLQMDVLVLVKEVVGDLKKKEEENGLSARKRARKRKTSDLNEPPSSQ